MLDKQQLSLITQQPQMIPSKLFSQSSSDAKKSLQQVHELYGKLHTTINEMDGKVQHVIKKHQTQFLFAYRNHIKKIKKQLAEIKFKSQQQERMFSSNDRIQYLEKQLAIFREETMKLYRKLDQRNQQLDLAKAKIKQLDRDNAHQGAQLKDFIKKAKFQEMNRIILSEKLQKLNQELKLKDQKIKSFDQGIALNKNNMAESSSKKFQYSRTSPMHSPKVNSYVNSSINTSSNFYRMPKSPRVYDTDLKSWFLECIKTVKRQISLRNNSEKGVQLNNINSIEQFMMIDKLRLLEIFLENQKLLSWMYQRIFPDRLSNLREKLSNSKLSSPPKQSLTERYINKSIQNQQQSVNLNHIKNSTKISYLPKVPRLSQNRPKFNQNGQWKGNVILKGGKLNISMGN